MSIRRITISVPTALAKQIKSAARDQPVSAWVTSLIEQRLTQDELDKWWEQYQRDNPPSPAQKRRADGIIRRTIGKRRAS